MPFRLMILETGEPAIALASDHGNYVDMFRAVLTDRFDAHETLLEIRSVALHRGEALPDISVADGFLITGSPLGVYEDHAFIAPLEDFIKLVLAAKLPMVGVCFGHQIMARALGGQVEKSEKGWGVGVHRYHVRDASTRLSRFSPGWASGAGQQQAGTFTCVVSHQDQVLLPTSDMETLAGSRFCPHGALLYAEGYGLSFQMHPEFTHEFAADLLETRLDRIDMHTVDKARQTFPGPSDREWLTDVIVEFFINHHQYKTIEKSATCTSAAQSQHNEAMN